MKWFRSRIKAGTRLALLALAVQFVLSFGHFHGAAALAAPDTHAVTAPASVAQLPDQATPATNELAGEAQQAPDQSHGDHHDGYCAICAVMSLAGTLLVSGPAILLIPDAYQVLNRTTDAEFFHLATPHGISQPRAPPAS